MSREHLPYTTVHAIGFVDETGGGVVDGVTEAEEGFVGAEVCAQGVDIDEASDAAVYEQAPSDVAYRPSTVNVLVTVPSPTIAPDAVLGGWTG